MCSKDFRLISVTGEGKYVNVDGNLDQKISASKNMADVYWNRENDSNYHEAKARYNENPEAWRKSFLSTWKVVTTPENVNLHEFAAYFKKDWTAAKTEFVTVITPSFLKPPKNTLAQNCPKVT